MQAWGRQCMARRAPSAGSPRRRMHWAFRRLRASHRPVCLRGRWAHTCYYKRVLTHIKTGCVNVRGVPLVLATPVHGTRFTNKRTLTHIKNGGIQCAVGAGQCTSRWAPSSGVTSTSRALGRTTSPAVLARPGRPASCQRRRLRGAPSRRARWRGGALAVLSARLSRHGPAAWSSSPPGSPCQEP